MSISTLLKAFDVILYYLLSLKLDRVLCHTVLFIIFQMFAEYDDSEVGALDLEEIEGFMPETHDMLLKAAEEFEESKRRYQLDKAKEIARYVSVVPIMHVNYLRTILLL